MTGDLVNATLELLGGLIILANVRAALLDQKIRGSHWLPSAFFSGWAVWNIYYYPSLGQYASAVAAVAPLSAHAWWLLLYWRFR